MHMGPHMTNCRMKTAFCTTIITMRINMKRMGMRRPDGQRGNHRTTNSVSFEEPYRAHI